MLGSFRPNPVEGLIVFGIPLAPNRVADAGFGHLVPFVSGINEHLGAIDLAILYSDLLNAPAFLLHGRQALLEIDAHLRLIEHLEEDVFGHMGLEGPHGGITGVQVIDRGAPATPGEILLAPLEAPRIAIRIMLRDAVIELARDAADGC